MRKSENFIVLAKTVGPKIIKLTSSSLCLMKEFFQCRLPLSFGLQNVFSIAEREGRNSRFFAPDLLKDLLTVDLFSVYLLSRVDIVIRYIEVDFTFGFPDYVRYIEVLFHTFYCNFGRDIEYHSLYRGLG